MGDLKGTGERVAAAWADDFLQGENIDPAATLQAGSLLIEPGERSLVIVRNIAVATMCPHHLLPAHGSATIAYLPENRIVGFGTIAQVVDALSRRLTLQERIGAGVVTLLVSELGAQGALCRLSLQHSCLIARGERKAGK